MKWMVVAERLPLIGEWVLVSADTGVSAFHKHCFMAARLMDGRWAVFNGGRLEKEKVTHWLPLPEPPEGYLLKMETARYAEVGLRSEHRDDEHRA